MKYEELENERLEAEEQAINEPDTFVPSHELSNDEQDNYAAVE